VCILYIQLEILLDKPVVVMVAGDFPSTISRRISKHCQDRASGRIDGREQNVCGLLLMTMNDLRKH